MKSDRAHTWLTSRLGHNGFEPTVGRQVPTRCIWGTFMAGASIATTAYWWSVTLPQVEDALRIEHALRRRHRWAVRWNEAQCEAGAKRIAVMLKQAKKARGRAASKV